MHASLTPESKSCRRLMRWLVLAMCVARGVAHAQTSQETFDDLAGRVEYAFYAADSAALRQSLQALEKLNVEGVRQDAWRDELGFARWKLAQLQVNEDRDAAGRSADACVDGLTTQSAAQHALMAACYALLAQARPLRSVWYHHAGEDHLQQALQMDAKGWRVQWLAAWIAAQRDPEAAASYTALNKVAVRLDDPATVSEQGQAEVFYLSGRMALARHDVLAARNALERAILIAPDYRDAQALLKQLSVK